MTMEVNYKDNQKKIEGAKLALRIKELRNQAGLTLQKLAKRCGLALSTISKIENNAISPTYGNLIRLATGLGMDVAELLTFEPETPVVARWSMTRKGEGSIYSIGNHTYEFLCTNISNRKMVPMVAHIAAQTLNEDLELNTHEGEEVMFVVSGNVVLHTEHYEPLALAPGDCVYIDSTMGHKALAADEEEAIVFWVCTDTRGMFFLDNGDAPQ